MPRRRRRRQAAVPAVAFKGDDEEIAQGIQRLLVL